MHRSILIHKIGSYWIFAHLFRKASTGNIKIDELQGVKDLSGQYKLLTDKQLDLLAGNKSLLEICHDSTEEKV